MIPHNPDPATDEADSVVDTPVSTTETPQVDLFGEPIDPDSRSARRGRRGAVTAAHWQALLQDEDIVARYRASIHWRGPDQCAYWLGSISSTGHGKLRVGSLTDGSRRVITAHLLGYQLQHGVLSDDLGDVVIGHTCDESSCQNPHHMEAITRADNDSDYRRRKHWWPLSDVRGAQRRAQALRDAIRSALDNDGDVGAALDRADAAGRPPLPRGTLF